MRSVGFEVFTAVVIKMILFRMRSDYGIYVGILK
jgi:hypothetical protein